MATPELLRRLFVARDDTYAVQQNNGYVRVNRPLTDEVLKAHLSGEITVGVYQLSVDSKVKWICFDVDGDSWEARKIFDYLKNHEKYSDAVALEYTGGRGYHIWLFFNDMIPATAARSLGQTIITKTGAKCELFPKQSKINDEGFGNLVKLPLGLHRKYNKWSVLLDPVDLLEITPVTLPQEVIEELVLETEMREAFQEWITVPDGECPALIRIQNGVEEGYRDEAAFWLARMFRKLRARPELALLYLREWDKLNKPPLGEKIIVDKVKSAYRKKYGVSFLSIKKNPVLSQLCEGCNIECVFEKKKIKARGDDGERGFQPMFW